MSGAAGVTAPSASSSRNSSSTPTVSTQPLLQCSKRHRSVSAPVAAHLTPAGGRKPPADSSGWALRTVERRDPTMCRWLAYSGSPILLEELLYKPKHSLIDQSLHARLGVETTNGDGFGVGWYGDGHDAPPAVFRAVGPAWSDQNLRELAA